MNSVSARPEGSLIWCLGFLMVSLLQLIWQFLNDTPPVWDMAFHQLIGWQLLEVYQQGGSLLRLSSISFPYPPLYHWTEALILSVLGDTRLIAFLANLPGLFFLSYGTYRLGRYYLSNTQAGWAGVLVLLFPMVAWISRESLLDVPLAGWVAVTGFLVLKSRFFEKRAWVLLLGLACAGGLLTKWTFPVYVMVPILFGFWKSTDRVMSLVNLALAGLLAFPLALVYYGPNFLLLASNYPTTDQAGLIPWQPYPRHGEPGLNNYLGWVYYPRVLASYFLFLPLTLLFLTGVVRSRKVKVKSDEGNIAFLWFWLIGGILLLTFVTPKDPRFAIPLVTPLAILLVRFWKDRPRLIAVVVVISIVQFILVSFCIPYSPPKLSLFSSPGDRDFQNIQREWVLFQPEYFGVAGPPRREKWPLPETLNEIPEGASVGMLPELPRFNVNGFQLQAVRVGKKVNALALGNLNDWNERMVDLDFVLTKTGHQGLSYLTRFNREIQEVLLSDHWRVVGEWALPDHSVARLLKNPEVSKSDAGGNCGIE